MTAIFTITKPDMKVNAGFQVCHWSVHFLPRMKSRANCVWQCDKPPCTQNPYTNMKEIVLRQCSPLSHHEYFFFLILYFLRAVLCLQQNWEEALRFPIYTLPLYMYSLMAHSFLFSPLSGYKHTFLIHTPTEGHLGCFQVLAIMNKAAINIHVQVFVWT